MGRAWARSIAAISLGAGFAFLLSACAELPSVGPTINEIEANGATLSTMPFVIIDVDKNVLQTLQSVRPTGFGGHFASRAPAPNLRIAVGDTVVINAIEQTAGLFSQAAPPTAGAAGSNGLAATPTAMQPIQVGGDGAMFVPFVGRVVAAGRTIESVRAEIQRKLENKAIFPQVQVAIVNSSGLPGNSATVGGEVNRAGIFPLQPSGSRLLDLIAEGGGGRFPAYETTIYLTRHGQRRQASLQNVIENPKENVYIYPHDDIYLARYQRTFSVLGASTKVGRYSFETAHVDLAEAVAIGGGFGDATADPAGVFVFRYEPERLVAEMMPNIAIAHDQAVPVLYRLNLRGGGGYFLSKGFQIQDKDVVLLANSEGAQLQKLLNILQTGTNIVLLGKTIATPNASVSVSPLTSVTTSPAP